ncbi:hypothetical protein AAZX31_05G105400 [Glycine max]|uniref:Uncharacterized protein n=1 Tax=Glycine soja TaxID=3848 RepID=A0A445KMQ5_GLYSO|nr:classical arabinogalactan protein 6-like [Glycine max]XP_028230823.1 classical arabinogalactan protein 6-like [Glycine soja]KAH1133885.1 hypothetical protein GYH30_012340 [Glycine max]RZC12018.1 hypothetical protein D0Y65_012002 [Glycine soja]|eukprot:XP_006580816.1 classical arabinogalactan protein 6-like [Glycine max]
MARQLVLALISVAIIGMAMANEAPSASPKSSPSPKASSSPKSAESPLSSPPAPTPSDESDISAAPAPASDPIELYAPEPEPFEDPFTTPEETDPADVTSGASALQFSGAVTAAAIAGIFAF